MKHEICRRSHCNTRKLERVDSIGRVALVCEPCARNRKGFCRDCPKCLERPRALRCDACAVTRRGKCQVEVKRRRYRDEKTRKKILAQKRASDLRPHVRTRRLAYLARWRAEHPIVRDAATRLYNREWARNKRARKRQQRQEQAA